MNVYGQYQWHEEAYLVGTVEELTQLRDQINRAIEQNKPILNEYMPSDGEGYTLAVIPVSEEIVWQLAVDYKADYAQYPEDSNGTYPYDLEGYIEAFRAYLKERDETYLKERNEKNTIDRSGDLYYNGEDGEKDGQGTDPAAY